MTCAPLQRIQASRTSHSSPTCALAWKCRRNPKGNGTQTVNLTALFPGENYQRIAGTQDAATNNGAPVTTVTLDERNGLILVKAP